MGLFRLLLVLTNFWAELIHLSCTKRIKKLNLLFKRIRQPFLSGWARTVASTICCKSIQSNNTIASIICINDVLFVVSRRISLNVLDFFENRLKSGCWKINAVSHNSCRCSTVLLAWLDWLFDVSVFLWFCSPLPGCNSDWRPVSVVPWRCDQFLSLLLFHFCVNKHVFLLRWLPSALFDFPVFCSSQLFIRNTIKFYYYEINKRRKAKKFLCNGSSSNACGAASATNL